nr:Gp15 family bacteriophage protein [Amycolatopsis camponoti]
MLYADWRREYGRDLMADLDDGLSWWEFAALVSGLSPDSVWRQVIKDEPIEVDGETARSVIGNL